MGALQAYSYFSGIIFFFIGCLFYYLSKKNNLSVNKKLISKRAMNVFLIIAFICVCYSWL